MAKICNQCGKEMPDGVLFCPECGYKAPADAPYQNAGYVPPTI